LSRQDIYAAAAAHDELGPEYSDAVVASFLAKVDEEIDARVDARLAGRRQPAPPAERDDLRTLLKGAAVGIGASGATFFVVGGNADERLHRVLWVLLFLVVICMAAAGWAGRRLENRRAVNPRPGRPTELPAEDDRLVPARAFTDVCGQTDQVNCHGQPAENL
jgi:hypothetical protein